MSVTSTIDIAMVDELIGEPLRAAMEPFGGVGQVTLLRQPNPLPDAVTQLLVHNPKGEPAAVLHHSGAAEDLVTAGVEQARVCAEFLGPDLGAVVLQPIMYECIDGHSFALMPLCTPLSSNRLRWYAQRRGVRGMVLDWLHDVAVRSQAVDADAVEATFVEPLQHMQDLQEVSAPIREAAGSGLARIRTGEWSPHTVLAHNDLWKGNILLPPRPGYPVPDIGGKRGFVLIDWAAGRPHGHAMYDLVRLAESLNMTPAMLYTELCRHCEALACDMRDLEAYLVAGLGLIGMNLGHFEPQRFHAMCERCFDLLKRALPN